ncbi:MAG: hypothetical protein JWR45_3644 [Blastococcus sp.]|jgi:uncharacterized OB-fold protein|nr:hypothetical protein [Blastococcus sp.]
MTTIDQLAREFTEALDRGELRYQHCRACDTAFMYPKPRCPRCHSADVEWAQAEGAGALVSMTIQRAGVPTEFESELPYALGVVRLVEGVTLLARLAPDGDGRWSDYVLDGPVRFAGAMPHPETRLAAAWFRTDIQETS